MIDTTTLQKKVDAVKVEIRNDSITPLIIGTILSEILSLIRAADLTDWKPEAEQAITGLQSDLSAEIMQRSSGDNELRAAIALLRRALDESEDGTFAQTVREDIRDIFDALTMLRDDQKLSQEDIDQIKADIESILGENASEAIENFNEILNFLEGVKDTDSLLGLLDNIRQTIRDNARDLQSHEDNDKTHINVLSLADEEDLDDATGMHVRPGLYRIRLGVDATQPDRDGDMFLFNVWGRWDYIISAEAGTWSVPVYRMKIDREGVWVQSGTYNSDNLYSHGEWQSLTSLLLTVKRISDTKADRTELSNILGTPTEGKIEDIEPGIVTTVLRKTPQALTPEEQAQVKINLAISKMELFCDLFNSYAVNKGYARITNGQLDCQLNGLPLTYEEAMHIIPYGRKILGPLAYNNGYHANIKTNFPPLGADTITITDCSGMCTGQAEMEVFVIHGRYDASYSNYRTILNATSRFFDSCFKLRQILGRFTLGKVPANIFHTCKALQDFNLIYLDQSVSFSESPLISLESVKYMIDNANNKSSPITVTVHPDVYAKLTDEANTDWHQVLLDAADKNITFATV